MELIYCSNDATTRSTGEPLSCAAMSSCASAAEVSTSTEEMSAQVEQMTSQAQELAATAEQLRSLAARFKLADGAAMTRIEPPVSLPRAA
jgi:hypothetical protein